MHSSTAFVQFKSLAAKQQAIQCNITGMNKYLTVVPVPEVRDIIWDNMHVSRALIETRKGWANVALFGGLILWSMLVSLIRSINNLSEILNSVVETPITEATAVAAFLDFYAPALIVEGLVRAIPNLMKVGALWLRFKSNSEKDHYILRWYFGFRLLTFLFILIGGTIVNSGNQFVNDPVGFFKELSGNLALNAQFFISYVIVSGGVQVFFRLSQWHNLALYSVMKSVKKSEALSQRKFNSLITKVQVSWKRNSTSLDRSTLTSVALRRSTMTNSSPFLYSFSWFVHCTEPLRLCRTFLWLVSTILRTKRSSF